MDLDRDLATARMVLARLEAVCRTAEAEVTRTREAGEAIGRVIVGLEAGHPSGEGPAQQADHEAADAAPERSEDAQQRLPAP
jgi:hypothetical protein